MTTLTTTRSTIKIAVDSMLAVHATTGHDLTCWPQVLPLVTSVYPDILIEGTGPANKNVKHTDHGETGRFWINGMQNGDAYADSNSDWAKIKKLLLDTEEASAVIGYLDNFGNVFEEDFVEEQVALIEAKSYSELGFKKVLASDFYQAELDMPARDENHAPVIYRFFD